MKQFLLGCALVFSCVNVASALELGFSGMTQIDNSHYLVVQDKKVFQDGERVGIFSINDKSVQSYTPIMIDDWQDADGQSSDLESVCKLPNVSNQYLLAESGYWDGKFGRIFHVTLEGNHAKVMHVYHVPKIVGGGKGKKGDNFEGMICSAFGDNTLVVLGERGGNKLYKHGYLRLGVLNTQHASLDWQTFADQAFEVEAPKSWHDTKHRSISDLYLDANDVIWAVATQDAGDNGPFRSVIYAAAVLDRHQDKAPISAVTQHYPKWRVDGFKVEALAAPDADIEDAVLSIGTEDEHYGGVWRPLFKQNKSHK